jgi:hypothetical protein
MKSKHLLILLVVVYFGVPLLFDYRIAVKQANDRRPEDEEMLFSAAREICGDDYTDIGCSADAAASIIAACREERQRWLAHKEQGDEYQRCVSAQYRHP